MRWPKYWSFSFNISPSNEHPGLISFRMDCWISLQSKGLSRVFSNTTVQKHWLKACGGWGGGQEAGSQVCGGWTCVCASPPLLCSETQIRAADLGHHVGRGPCSSLLLTHASTGSLASQRHPGKFPKVPCRSRGKRGFPAAP